MSQVLAQIALLEPSPYMSQITWSKIVSSWHYYDKELKNNLRAQQILKPAVVTIWTAAIVLLVFWAPFETILFSMLAWIS